MVVVREYKCGCKITSEKNYSSIVYCPIHGAAPEMYEALEKIASCKSIYSGDVVDIARKTLFKAEGK